MIDLDTSIDEKKDLQKDTQTQEEQKKDNKTDTSIKQEKEQVQEDTKTDTSVDKEQEQIQEDTKTDTLVDEIISFKNGNVEYLNIDSIMLYDVDTGVTCFDIGLSVFDYSELFFICSLSLVGLVCSIALFPKIIQVFITNRVIK